MAEPLTAEALQQVRALLGDDYGAHDLTRPEQLLLGTGRKLLATLDVVLDAVDAADDRLNIRGDPIACHLYLDKALKDTGRRQVAPSGVGGDSDG